MHKLKYYIIFFILTFVSLDIVQTKAIAEISLNCIVNSPLFNFSAYKPEKNESNAITTTVTVTCTNMKQDIPYKLSLSKPKQLFVMSKGNEIMYYQIFITPNFTILWDDTNTISGIVKNNNGKGEDSRTVYGKILRNDIGVRTGNYNIKSDPVIIDLYYLP
jgi:spore coat protein U-like protein